jgi:hypothetical protein
MTGSVPSPKRTRDPKIDGKALSTHRWSSPSGAPTTTSSRWSCAYSDNYALLCQNADSVNTTDAPASPRRRTFVQQGGARTPVAAAQALRGPTQTTRVLPGHDELWHLDTDQRGSRSGGSSSAPVTELLVLDAVEARRPRRGCRVDSDSAPIRRFRRSRRQVTPPRPPQARRRSSAPLCARSDTIAPATRRNLLPRARAVEASAAGARHLSIR